MFQLLPENYTWFPHFPFGDRQSKKRFQFWRAAPSTQGAQHNQAHSHQQLQLQHGQHLTLLGSPLVEDVVVLLHGRVSVCRAGHIHQHLQQQRSHLRPLPRSSSASPLMQPAPCPPPPPLPAALSAQAEVCTTLNCNHLAAVAFWECAKMVENILH